VGRFYPLERTPETLEARKQESVRNPYGQDGGFKELPPPAVLSRDRRIALEEQTEGKMCRTCGTKPTVANIKGEQILRCGCYPSPPVIRKPPTQKEQIKERYGDIIMQQLAIREVSSIQADEIKEFIAPNASEKQIKFFLKFCVFEGLNPFKNEVYYIPFKNKNGATDYAIVTGIDTFRKRASRHPRYAGHQTGIILQTPSGTFRYGEGEFQADNEVLVGAWSDCYLQGVAHPFRDTVKLADYDKELNVWQTHKALMISKVCEAHALKKHFPEAFADMSTTEGTVMTEADFPDRLPEVVEGSSTLVLEKGSASAQEQAPKDLLCPVHKLNWFKTRNGYAHEIPGEKGPKGGKVWCDMERTLAQLRDSGGELPPETAPTEEYTPEAPQEQGEAPPITLGQLLTRCLDRWGKYKEDVLDALGTSDPASIIDFAAAWKTCLAIFGTVEVAEVGETKAPEESVATG
jgi:phage recombination protein Bet